MKEKGIHARPASGLVIPAGLEPWLAEAIAEVEKENSVLERVGAVAQLTARRDLLRLLLEHAERWLDQDLSVAEAARENGRSPETIRRAVRAGRLPDRRTSKQGHHTITRRDLRVLDAEGKGEYDPVADAQDIARLRRRS